MSEALMIRPDAIETGMFSGERFVRLLDARGQLVWMFLDVSFVKGSRVEVYPVRRTPEGILVQFGDQDGTRCLVDFSRVD